MQLVSSELPSTSVSVLPHEVFRATVWETGRNWGRLRGGRLPIGGGAGEPGELPASLRLRGRRTLIGVHVGEAGEPPVEVGGEFVVEHSGADLE